MDMYKQTTLSPKEQIIHNIKTIRDRMQDACLRAGRHPDEVRLLLAVKTVAPEIIKIAIEAGEKLIGENKVQEFAAKYEALKDVACERHFIGHLQTNKIKEVIRYVSCIQSVDRIALAEKLHQRLLFEQRQMDVLIEVNTSLETGKSGIVPGEVFDLLKSIQPLETLRIKGFMTIGLFDADAEKVRPCFTKLREIRDEAILRGLVADDVKELSMGMSGDLETAIEEGATIIRVGSAIFGKRVYSN